MATTCQHCGVTAEDDARVMCPSCGRRMRPAHPEAAAQPTYAAGPPYATPSPYAPATPYAPASPYAPAYSNDAGLPPAVEVGFRRDVLAGASRVTVAFRLLLVIPHLIVLYGVGIAAFVVTVVAWFAALFTGRVPAGLYGFVAWVVGYATRVMSYLFFLTDRWPTFAEGADDPVRVRLPGSLPLNRAAVLFRIILLIPVALLADLVSSGLVVASVVGWLVVLVTGRVPQTWFEATASAVRFQTRYTAYAAMLTARYPGGLFGDLEDATAADESAAPPVITRAAHRLLVLFLVLGAFAFAGQVARAAALSSQTARARSAYDAVTRDYRSLHITSDRTCIGASDELACVQKTASDNAQQMRGFVDSLGQIDFPRDGGISGAVDDLRYAANVFATDLENMSHATSLSDYQQMVQDHDVEQAGRAVDQAVQDLENKLADYPNSTAA
jgi:hypothetical protein